jgi:adenylylsulfate kinase
VVLDKDLFRASIFPRKLIEYSTEQDDFVVDLMLDVAGYLLRHQPERIVIVDGRPFSKKYQVDAVVEFAKRVGTPWRIVECVCPEKVALKRLKANRKHVAGNRNAKLYHEVKAGLQKIRRKKIVFQSTNARVSNISEVERYLGN